MKTGKTDIVRGAVSWLPYALAVAIGLLVIGFVVSILSLRVQGRYFTSSVAASLLYAQEHDGEAAISYEGDTRALDSDTGDRLYDYITQAAYMRPSLAGEGQKSVVVDFGGGSSLYARDAGTKLVYVEYTALGGKTFRATLQYPVVNAGWKGLMNCLGLPAE